MKIHALFCCVLTLSHAVAQEIDMEARRESVKTLKANIGMREERFEEVMAELMERAEKTDKKVGKIVEVLSGLKDSNDSKRMISQLKAKATAGLKGMIAAYDRERRDVLEQLRKDAGPAAEGLKSDLQKLDALISKRADDMVKLAKSIPTDHDVEKYESDGGTYFYGYHHDHTRISDEWRQNRRDKVQSSTARRELQEALKDAIEDLEQRRAAVEAALKEKKFTPAQKELREQELERTELLLETRNAQLADVAASGYESAGQPAGESQAMDLKNLLDDARGDIASDMSRNIKLYHELTAERARIAELRANLVAREKWLEENAGTAE